MSEGIYEFPSPEPPRKAYMRSVQVWIDAELAAAIDSWRSKQPDEPSRNAAVMELTRTGLARKLLNRE